MGGREKNKYPLFLKSLVSSLFSKEFRKKISQVKIVKVDFDGFLCRRSKVIQVIQRNCRFKENFRQKKKKNTSFCKKPILKQSFPPLIFFAKLYEHKPFISPYTCLATRHHTNPKTTNPHTLFFLLKRLLQRGEEKCNTMVTI